MRAPADGTDRGQSDLIGYALIFSIAFLIVTLLLVVGGAAVDDTERSAQMTRAEQGFTELDNRLGRVSAGSSEVQTVDLGIDGDSLTSDLEYRDTGSIEVSYVNTTSGSETLVYEGKLGSLVYTNGDQTVAYQGGGVWRHRANDTVIVSPPEFYHRDDTLILPIITVDANGKLDSKITVQREAQPVERYPNTDINSEFTNRIVDKKVQVTVQSRYYKGWGRYFQRQAPGGVDYDHSADSVTATFFNPPPKVTNALRVIGGDGGELRIQSGANLVVDNYNSSTVSADRGPNNPPTTDGSADLWTDKDVRFGGNAKITGNLTTTGAVTKWSGSDQRIEGYLSYGDGSVSSSDCNTYVGSWCANNASEIDTRPLDAEIQHTIDEVEQDNDNGDTSCFSESEAVEFSDCGSTVTLDDGDYYTTDRFEVGSGQKLVLDTTDGSIRIGVDDAKPVVFTDGANVTVVGDGAVRFYATERYTIAKDDTKIWNRGWDAPQMWMYCSADCSINVKSGPTIVGTFYAPSAPGSTAEVNVESGSGTKIYGALVGGGDAELTSNADIYFDKDLKSQQVLARPSVSYLHVRVYKDEMSSS